MTKECIVIWGILKAFLFLGFLCFCSLAQVYYFKKYKDRECLKLLLLDEK